MHKTRVMTVALLMTTFGAASAQPPEPGPRAAQFRAGVLGIGVDPLPVRRLVLIQRPAVQDELKLSDAQKKKLTEIQGGFAPGALMENIRQNRAPGENVGRERLEEEGRAYIAAREALGQDLEAKIARVLEPKQRTRLEQVRLQAEGPLGFSDPELIQRLNLAPEQVEPIQEIVATGRETMMNAARVPLKVGPGEGRLSPKRSRELTESKEFLAAKEASRAATLKARAATMKAIARVLTERQIAEYQKMLGEPFDFARLQAPAPRQ